MRCDEGNPFCSSAAAASTCGRVPLCTITNRDSIESPNRSTFKDTDSCSNNETYNAYSNTIEDTYSCTNEYADSADENSYGYTDEDADERAYSSPNGNIGANSPHRPTYIAAITTGASRCSKCDLRRPLFSL